MAMKEFQPGSVLFESGQTLDKIYLVVRGSVRASFPGGSYLLKNGDIAGLADINFRETFLRYEAVEKTTVVEYVYEPGNLSGFVGTNKDTVKYLFTSLFHQLGELSGHYTLIKNEFASLKDYLSECYEDYKACCEKIALSPGELAGFDDAVNVDFEEVLPDWITGYYNSLREIVMGSDVTTPDPDFLIGLITKSGRDLREMVSLSGEIESNKSDIHNLLMNESAMDLFELYQSLYVKGVKKLGIDDPSVGKIYRLMNDLLMQIETEGIDKEPFFEARKAQYEGALKLANELASSMGEKEETHGKEQLEQIADSLKKIVEYSGVDEETAKSFVDSVNAYKNT
ncbi:MAG: hypothetical protein K5888_12345, partial [Lachnospiraceae bacterium]|nr:hypothetical protein [Lachnospiraceae bacterium]